MLAIETVAVLGSGEAAYACAILSALSGCAVRVHDPAPEALDRAFEAVRFRVDVAIERGLLTRSDRQRILDGILFSPDLAEAVTGADLVLELEDDPVAAGSELGRLTGLVRASAALAAPSVEAALALLATVPQPGRVLALQADRSSGFTRVVVLPTPHTSRHTLEAVEAFAARVNARGRHEA
jgi:3-hydroxyacyl-CoA dehydrogenase-like protein